MGGRRDVIAELTAGHRLVDELFAKLHDAAPTASG